MSKPTTTIKVTKILAPFTEIKWSTDTRTRVVVKGVPFRVTEADHNWDQKTARRYATNPFLRIIVYFEINGRPTQQTWWYFGAHERASKVTTFQLSHADPKVGHAECLQSIFTVGPVNVIIAIPPETSDGGEGSGTAAAA